MTPDKTKEFLKSPCFFLILMVHYLLCNIKRKFNALCYLSEKFKRANSRLFCMGKYTQAYTKIVKFCYTVTSPAGPHSFPRSQVTVGLAASLSAVPKPSHNIKLSLIGCSVPLKNNILGLRIMPKPFIHDYVPGVKCGHNLVWRHYRTMPLILHQVFTVLI